MVESRTTREGKDRDIAIVGMACVLPGAEDLRTFWQNIVSGVDAICDPPPGDLLHRAYSPESVENDRVYCNRGGFLHGLPSFKSSEFGVMPNAVDGAEPEHFIALQVANAALADAGVPEIPLNRERTEVILGRGTFASRAFVSVMQHGLVIDQTIDLLRQLHPEHGEEMLSELRQQLKAQLPNFAPETAPGICHSVMAGIISNRLNLKGRNVVVDAACASCHQAMEIAVGDLRAGTCDAAIVGGVQVSSNLPIYMVFSQLGALSRQDHLKPFDKNADGTMLGEGLGMVVVKRLSDALDDGNRIYAVVKGVGSASDGKLGGLLAPQEKGEELALRRAYDDATIEPSTVALIEAHGTGIPLGDITELNALRNVFGETVQEGSYPCAIGSVKSMIGHLIPAAGIAGLIKTSLALYHKVYPPTICCDEPNPDLEIDKTPFYINTSSRPWIHGLTSHPRTAGVNAFGFGGINSHVILAEHTDDAQELLGERWPAELFAFTGKNRKELIAKSRGFLSGLSSLPVEDSGLADLAYSVSHDVAGESRLAIVAANPQELQDKLAHAVQLLEDESRARIRDKSGIFYFDEPLGSHGKTAFMFPGEGSQYVNMLADVCRCFPEARSCFDLLDRAYADLPGADYASRFIFPPEGMSKDADRKIFTMHGAVDAVTTANRALFRVLQRLEMSPDAMVGHSSGELMALEASKGVSLLGEEDLLSYIRMGNSIIRSLEDADDIPYGRLLAVGGAPAETVQEIVDNIDGFLVIAMMNCPHQCVICGTDATIAEAERLLRGAGAICQLLPFERAYHTELFKPALQRLSILYRKAEFQATKVPLYSCLNADIYPDDPDSICTMALDQWVNTVRFQDTVEKMYDDGFRIFVEVGPRANLSSFVGDILKKKAHCAVATNVHHKPGMVQLLYAVGQLFAHGVDINLENLFSSRKVSTMKMAENGGKPGMSGVELKRDLPFIQLSEEALASFRQAVEPVSRATEEKATVVPPQPVPSVDDTSSQGSRGQLDPVMVEYFKTMEHFLHVQQQTMQAALSAGGDGRLISSEMVVAPPPVCDRNREPAVEAVEGSQAVKNGTVKQDKAAEDTGRDLQDVKNVLLRIVSERTGYPENMLGLEQDMEAELGIDSIKRVEILGALAASFGQLGEGERAALNEMKTLGQIIRFLEETTGQQDRPSEAGKKAEDRPVKEPPGKQEAQTAASPPGGNIKGVAEVLLQIVSERTGYPTDMLGLDQDMEAELGIDSIKFVEIIGALMSELGIEDKDSATHLRGLRTLRQIISSMEDSGKKSDARHPFTVEVTVIEEGRAHEMKCDLDLKRFPFLKDHTLGGNVSRTDPDLHGLAILPFTVSLEIAAAAGAGLFPKEMLVGFRKVKVVQWIMFRDERRPLLVRAEKSADERSVQTRLYLVEGESRTLALEAEVLFGQARSRIAGITRGEGPESGRPTGVPDSFYPGPLFHGPSFRHLQKVVSWGDNEATAAIKIEQGRNGVTDRQLLCSPFGLDAAGQVIGLWASNFVPLQYVIFPSSVDLIVYDATNEFSSGICETTNRATTDEIFSDVSFFRDDGTCWCRMEKFRHTRTGISELLHNFRGSREVFLSTPWHLPLPMFGESEKYSVCFLATEILQAAETERDFIAEVIAHIILSRRERETWNTLSYRAERRMEWLAGRIAAKEAVRRLLSQQGVADVWCADIEIVVNGTGQPQVVLETGGIGGWQPLVSISHSRGSAIALATMPDNISGVGIDLEELEPVDESVKMMLMDMDEKGALAGLAGADEQRVMLSAWCGREAVVKSLGGLNGTSLSIESASDDLDSFIFKVYDEKQQGTGRPMPASICVKNNWVVAVSVSG